jgi:myo-inositol 2-dehydrogenase/D-chiro-inositol 1-dehydrogenase
VRDCDRTRSTGYAADWRPRFADAYRLELQAWVDSVAVERPSPLPTAHESVVTAAVADAVITSMNDSGRWIPVDASAIEASAG